MIRSLWASASGMMAQQVGMDTIANNLANVNTAGFKKARVDFKDLVYQKLGDNGLGTTQPPGSENTQIGNGVAPVSAGILFEQGTLESTGRPLDLAIQGEGFFAVRLPDGRTGYTRDGCFHVDSQGYVVNSDGYYLLYDGNNRLSVPQQNVADPTVASDGTLRFGDSYGAYQVRLFKFVNPEGLTALGRNCFVESPSSGYAISGSPGSSGYGTIVQGYLERSNVSVIEEMVKMITVQRAYELNSKAVQSSDEMLGIANNLRR